MAKKRILSGMRPTGKLHLGHLVGALENWVSLLGGKSYAQLFQSPSPVAHFWSLAIEEQFYWLWPPVVAGLLVWSLRGDVPLRRATWALCGLFVLFSLSVPLTRVLWSPDAVYFASWTRFAEILAGGALAAFVALLVAYVAWPLFLLQVIRQGYGAGALMTMIGLIVVSDSAQYYTGRAFGRRKLAPVISPKKTWEGLVGGTVAALLIAVVLVREMASMLVGEAALPEEEEQVRAAQRGEYQYITPEIEALRKEILFLEEMTA